MNTKHSQRIAIVGAGLGGSLLACFLARQGHEISLFERRSDPREEGFIGGRSINLAISERGLHALRGAGLETEVLKHAIPMPGRMIHPPSGAGHCALHYLPYSKNSTDRINSVSRSQLNLVLLDAAARHSNVTMYFDHRCESIDFKNPSIAFEDMRSHQRVSVETDRIVGADGAFSAVRLQMMLSMDRFEYSQHYLEHGYKELVIPPAAECGVPTDRHDGFAMEPKALHIWPRGGYMMIALPNEDRSFTCTCFWPYTGPNGLESLRSRDEILRYFETHFPDAVPLMPTLVEDYQRNPNGSLVTVRCQPWHLGDKALLIGDAAHAIVPFYGQGANAAFEDCVALDECVKAHAPNWHRVFEEFNQQRKTNADAIAAMAVDNFFEMRDKTASPVFRSRKKIEHALHGLFPKWFMPLYNMISFSTIPYAQARARSRRQWTIVCGTVMAVFAAIIFALFALLTNT
jgi:kynurenine 3-monooxygenase